MRLITLNTWGGKIREPLFNFLKEKKNEVDIFCFQEVSHRESKITNTEEVEEKCNDLYTLFENILSEHKGYFRPNSKDSDGLAIFVRKEIKVIEEGELFVFKEKGYVPKENAGFHARNIQYVIFDTPHGARTAINFHGLWNGKGKTDTEDRLVQSENILNFIKDLETPFVLCGDFNLSPTTKSLTLFEDAGLQNLVKKYGITSTRTSFYMWPDKYADYVFLSPEIFIKSFSVLPQEVSDHAALMVDFE